MKKKILLLTAFLLSSSAITFAQDCAKFGLKGTVVGTSTGLNFNSRGNLESGSSVTLENGTGNYVTIKNAKFSGTKLVGSVYDNTATVSFAKNGKPSSLSYNDGYYYYTTTYTYGNDGLLASATTQRTWTETTTEHIDGSAAMNAAAKQRKQLEAKAAKLNKNSAEYKTIAKQIDALAKKSGANINSGYNKTHSNKRNETVGSITYSDYKFDELGNWTSRKNSNSYSTESRTISYEPEYLSGYRWDKIQKRGNLAEVEQFAKASTTTSTYKAKAKEYWNGKILGQVEKSTNNDIETLCHVASNSIATTTTKDNALKIARQKLWDEKITPERDFVKLKDLANKVDNGLNIFDDSDKNKILDMSEQYKRDSLTWLKNKAQKEFESQNYTAASHTATGALVIDPSNFDFKAQKAEAEYQLLKRKQVSNTITDEDYAVYLDQNPGSTYTDQLNDERAQMAIDNWNKANYYDKSSFISSLTMSDKLRKKSERRAHHLEYLNERGSFFHIGPAMEYAFGRNNNEFGAGLGMSFGWRKNLLNVYLGAQFNSMFNPASMGDVDENGDFKNDNDHKGSLSATRLTIPAMLRLNMIRKYNFDFYLGAGANFNVHNFSGYYGMRDGDEKYHVKDKKISRSTTITPRVALGISKSFIEAEVYGLYELKDSPYDNDYIEENSIDQILDEKYGKNQLKNKLRIGLTIRIPFV